MVHEISHAEFAENAEAEARRKPRAEGAEYSETPRVAY